MCHFIIEFDLLQGLRTFDIDEEVKVNLMFE